MKKKIYRIRKKDEKEVRKNTLKKRTRKNAQKKSVWEKKKILFERMRD